MCGSAAIPKRPRPEWPRLPTPSFLEKVDAPATVLATWAGLERIMEGEFADRAISKQFRTEDWRPLRGTAVPLIYGVLRWREYLDSLLGVRPRAVDANLARLTLYRIRIRHEKAGVAIGEALAALRWRRDDAVEDGWEAEPFKDWLNQARQTVPGDLSDRHQRALAASLPPWIADIWADRYDEATYEQLLRIITEEAPVTLRPNQLQTTRTDLVKALADTGFEGQPGMLVEAALLLRTSENLFQTAAFREGSFEVQDQTPQLVAEIVTGLLDQMDEDHGPRLLDLCAGSGGKTLAVGARLGQRGVIISAVERENQKKALKQRCRRAGLQNYQPAVLDANWKVLKAWTGKMDVVLVDAPCSGLGTLRRNPEHKWRMDPDAVAELASKQRQIVAGAARYVRPGGFLVYATCTLVAAENEAIIQGFLEANRGFSEVGNEGLVREETAAVLRPTSPGWEIIMGVGGADGGYFAVLQRETESGSGD